MAVPGFGVVLLCAVVVVPTISILAMAILKLGSFLIRVL